MNTIVKALVFVLSFVVVQVSAQDFHGVATFKLKRKVEIKLDSTQKQGLLQWYS